MHPKSLVNIDDYSREDIFVSSKVLPALNSNPIGLFCRAKYVLRSFLSHQHVPG